MCACGEEEEEETNRVRRPPHPLASSSSSFLSSLFSPSTTTTSTLPPPPSPPSSPPPPVLIHALALVRARKSASASRKPPRVERLSKRRSAVWAWPPVSSWSSLRVDESSCPPAPAPAPAPPRRRRRAGAQSWTGCRPLEAGSPLVGKGGSGLFFHRDGGVSSRALSL